MIETSFYHPNDEADWDQLIEQSTSGSFLHTRRFLSYHGDRFEDASLCIWDERGQLIGVLPAARLPSMSGSVSSHPGLTYGGLIHSGKLTGQTMLNALEAVAAHYASAGFDTLQYKVVPRIYHRRPAEDDLYALFRLGAHRVRSDLSVTIDLRNPSPRSERRKRGLRKARTAELTMASGARYLPEFWEILTRNLSERHGVTPVHSLSEITTLQELFPENIRVSVALSDEKVIAGTVLFLSRPTHHAQYIASSPEGHQGSALDLVFEHCIGDAQSDGARYFDFGTCTEDGGWHLNAGLYDFKSGFGGSGTVHDFFELPLT